MNDRLESLRKLVPMFRELRNRRSANKPQEDEVRLLPIESVLPNGHYVVGGAEVPSTGTADLRVGQEVAVGFQQGKPVVIFAQVARRAQFPVGPTPPGGSVIEELFVADDPDSGLKEVWYRNGAFCINLKVRKNLEQDPFYAKFSRDGKRFVVCDVGTFVDDGIRRGRKYYIFSLSRNSQKADNSSTSAKFIRQENVLASNITLCSIRLLGVMTGETSYADFDQPVGNPSLPDPTAVAITLPASGAQDLTRDIVFNSVLHDGVPTFFFKSANLDEVHVDDAGDLIGVVTCNLQQALLRQHNLSLSRPSTGLTGTALVWDNPVTSPSTRWQCNTSSYRQVETFGPGVSGFDYPVPNGQTFLINFTKKQVLFRTCEPLITLSVVTEFHSFKGAKERSPNQADPTDPNLLLCFFNPFPFISGFQVWSSFTPPPAILSAWVQFGSLGITGHHSRTIIGGSHPILASIVDDMSTWFQPSDVTTSADLETNTGTAASDLFVSFSLTSRTLLQTKQYLFGANYQPVKGNKLGILFLKAKKLPVQVAPLTDEFIGMFRLDLNSMELTTIEQYVANSSRGQIAFPFINGSAYFDSETYPWIDVIGVTTHHILYRLRTSMVSSPGHSAVTDAIKLYSTDLNTGATIELTVTIDPDNAPVGTLFASMKAVEDFYRRAFYLLISDFMYWAADSDFDALKGADKFIKAWKFSTGEVTLTATANLTPPVDGILNSVAKLQHIKQGVTPQKKSSAIRDYNADLEVIPGPSYRVIDDSSVLSPLGHFKSS